MMIFFRAELEREAGGSIFNAAEGTETRNQVCKQLFRIFKVFGNSFAWQVENTRYHGSSFSSGSSGSRGSSGHSSGSSKQSSSSSGAASSSSTLDSNDVVETNGGKWVWSEASQKWEWEAEAGAHQVCSLHHCSSHFRNSFEAKFSN